MTKCLICNQNIGNLIKTINGYDIIECTPCRLASTRRNNYPTSNINELGYNFEIYNNKKREYEDRFNKNIEIIEKFISKGHFLDIGSGYGLFALQLAKKGFSVDCVEPYLEVSYAKNNKNIRVYKSSFDNYNNQTTYDAVVFFDVLEHMYNPKSTLLKVHKILKKDGLIIIQLPNYQSLMAKLCINWAWWMVDDHKFHFSKKSITTLLNDTNYSIKHIETYEDFVDLKKNLDGNFIKIKNNYFRKTIKLLFFGFFTPLYFIFRKVLWIVGYGGLIYVIAEKK